MNFTNEMIRENEKELKEVTDLKVLKKIPIEDKQRYERLFTHFVETATSLCKFKKLSWENNPIVIASSNVYSNIRALYYVPLQNNQKIMTFSKKYINFNLTLWEINCFFKDICGFANWKELVENIKQNGRRINAVNLMTAKPSGKHSKKYFINTINEIIDEYNKCYKNRDIKNIINNHLKWLYNEFGYPEIE